MQRLSAYMLMAVLIATFEQAVAQQNIEQPASAPVNLPAENIPEANGSAPFIIRNIVITGNKKTKSSIILREIPFRPGDHFQLQQLVAKFEDARKQLMNTALFHEVVVALKSFEGYNVDIMVDVKERWYIFPVPYFKLVDRNLNQWLVQNKANLNRVNFGIKVMHNNFTGLNDKLNVWLMTGYTKQVSASYNGLYFDKKMKWVGKFGFSLGKNREVNYQTVNNKEVFLKDTNNFIRSFFKTNFQLTYRRAIKTRHHFGLSYNEEKIEDTIVKLNPEYFAHTRDHIRFPEIYYSMDFFNVDYIPYPLRGFEAQIDFRKKGFNNAMNLWELQFSTGNYFQVLPKTYVGINTSGAIKLPFKQPFYNKRLMGYGDMYIQGYEYYVMDGVVGGCIKTTLSRELFKLKVPVPRTKKRTLSYIPFRFFGKIYGDAGYVYNPDPGENRLTNRMLFSTGIGLDIITIYDVDVRIEWSFNQLGENSIYLHRRSNNF